MSSSDTYLRLTIIKKLNEIKKWIFFSAHRYIDVAEMVNKIVLKKFKCQRNKGIKGLKHEEEQMDIEAVLCSFQFVDLDAF